MVLNEVSSGQEPSPSFSDTQPTSDIDPYAKGNSNPGYTTTTPSNYIRIDQPSVEPIYINADHLPRPVFGMVPAHYPQRIQHEMTKVADRTREVLKRPLKQQEAEALAYYHAKGLRMASYGVHVGAGVALLQAYRTQDKGYRFPFWSPMKEGSGRRLDRFLNLRGKPAELMWFTMRTGSWLAMGMLLGTTLFATYAASHTTASRLMDPRLKDLRDALTALARERRGDGVPKQQNEGEGARAGETFEMARQRRAVQRQVPTQRTRQQQDDDMSPTGGAFQDDIRQGDADTGLMDDGQVRSHEYSRQREQVRAEAEANYNTQTISTLPQQQQRGSSQANTSSSRQQQPQSKSGGSAWDRLRQDAMSGNQGQSSNTKGARSSTDPRNTTSNDNSFNFSSADSDRQLAKSEAQKDFDARIERERSGKDFSESSRGGNSRW